MKLHKEIVDEIGKERKYLFSKIYKKRKIIMILFLMYVFLTVYTVTIDRANAKYTSKLHYNSNFKHYTENTDEFSILVKTVKKYAPTEKIFATITLKKIFNNEHNTDMNITYTIYENWLTGAKRYFVSYSACPITEKVAPGKFLSYTTYHGGMEVNKEMSYLGGHKTSDVDDIAPEAFLEEYREYMDQLKYISECYFK